MSDVLVIGAGIVGAAVARSLAMAGLAVTVLDRGAAGGGTSSGGEGNLLVSDKLPGPELEMALRANLLWPRVVDELTEELGAGFPAVEYERKGGLVVATTAAGAPPLLRFAATQSAAGIDARAVSAAEARELEPHLNPAVTAAVFYPEDAQVQPLVATEALLASARRHGAEVRTGVEVTGPLLGGDGRLTGVQTTAGAVPPVPSWSRPGPGRARSPGGWASTCRSGPPGGGAGDHPDAAPGVPQGLRRRLRRGGGVQRRGPADLQRRGVDRLGDGAHRLLPRAGRLRRPAPGRGAAAAGRPGPDAVPLPGRQSVMRAYGGFRPYMPDHLPVVGPDPRLPGLWHATGHEGAGIGLSVATGELIRDLVLERPTQLDPAPFGVQRASAAHLAMAGART